MIARVLSEYRTTDSGAPGPGPQSQRGGSGAEHLRAGAGRGALAKLSAEVSDRARRERRDGRAVLFAQRSARRAVPVSRRMGGRPLRAQTRADAFYSHGDVRLCALWVGVALGCCVRRTLAGDGME